MWLRPPQTYSIRFWWQTRLLGILVGVWLSSGQFYHFVADYHDPAHYLGNSLCSFVYCWKFDSFATRPSWVFRCCGWNPGYHYILHSILHLWSRILPHQHVQISRGLWQIYLHNDSHNRMFPAAFPVESSFLCSYPKIHLEKASFFELLAHMWNGQGRTLHQTSCCFQDKQNGRKCNLPSRRNHPREG